MKTQKKLAPYKDKRRDFIHDLVSKYSSTVPSASSATPSEDLAPLYARISELQAQVAVLTSSIASQTSVPSASSGPAASTPSATPSSPSSPVPSAPVTGSPPSQSSGGPASTPPSSSGTPASTPSSVPISPYFFPRDLGLNDEGDDVKELQFYLNRLGFRLAEDGPGSPGNETERYGASTSEALTRFQEAYRSEILDPLGLADGTGYFGPRTRRKMNGG